MTAPAYTPAIGEFVQFRDHRQLRKPALVTATRDTIDPSMARDGGQVPTLGNQDEIHCLVFSPTGSTEVRLGIRRGNGPGEWEPLPNGRH